MATTATATTLRLPLEPHSKNETSMTLDEAVHARHASRWFKPTPVPTSTLRAALDLDG